MPTIIVGMILLVLVALVVYKMIRDKKRGKSCCGDCSHCSMNSCHSRMETDNQ